MACLTRPIVSAVSPDQEEAIIKCFWLIQCGKCSPQKIYGAAGPSQPGVTPPASDPATGLQDSEVVTPGQSMLIASLAIIEPPKPTNTTFSYWLKFSGLRVCAVTCPARS